MFGANKNSTEERMSGAKWTKMYESLVRLKRANEKRKESPGASAENGNIQIKNNLRGL